jgi:hypothetical protein
MAKAAFDPQPGEGGSRSSQGNDLSSSADERYRDLLETMLSGLGEQGEVPEKLDSYEELLAVARRRRGESFACDPIGVELVQTVLKRPFRTMIASEEQWRTMTGQIAQTLCEDPQSHDRLSTLWRRLGERCDNGGK